MRLLRWLPPLNDNMIIISHFKGIDISYDTLGRRTRQAYSNGAVSGYRFDAAGRLTALEHGVLAASSFAAFAYLYDDAGNTVSVADASGARTNEYDALDRLVAASHPSLAAENCRYDAAGRLLAAEGATYLYGKKRNPIRKNSAAGTTTYTWDISNQLVRIDLPAAVSRLTSTTRPAGASKRTSTARSPFTSTILPRYCSNSMQAVQCRRATRMGALWTNRSLWSAAGRATSITWMADRTWSS